MDDNTKEMLREAYHAGWKARGEYIADYRDANTGTGFGLALMFLGGMVFSVFSVSPFFWTVVIIERLVVPLLISAVVIVAGYFINKAEGKSYNKKQAAFKEKWGD